MTIKASVYCLTHIMFAAVDKYVELLCHQLTIDLDQAQATVGTMDAVTRAAVLQKAEDIKQAGNKALQARDYQQASDKYSQAMTVLLTAMQRAFDTLTHDERAAMDLTDFTEPLSVIYSNWYALHT